MRAFGASQADIERAVAQYKSQSDAGLETGVEPANVLVVSTFNVMCRYWQRVGMDGSPVALDIQAGVLALSFCPWWVELDTVAKALVMRGITDMEQACLTAWHDQRERNKVSRGN